MSKENIIIYQAERALYNQESRSINNITFEGTKETDLLIYVNDEFVTQGVLYVDDNYTTSSPKGKLYNADETIELTSIDDILKLYEDLKTE